MDKLIMYNERHVTAASSLSNIPNIAPIFLMQMNINSSTLPLITQTSSLGNVQTKSAPKT